VGQKINLWLRWPVKRCEQKKAAKAATDKAWKAMVEAHKVEVDAWTIECAHLRALKVKVKGLPKKPKIQSPRQ
jgi:hypothetical protein